MSVALSLIIPFETEAKQERVLGLFKDIADSTLANEPENQAYCWFRKSKQNALDGPQLYGLEVYVNLSQWAGTEFWQSIDIDKPITSSYENEDASKITHRNGKEYKHMRAVALEEKLFMRATNLVYQKPAVATAFLSKENSVVRFSSQQAFYVVVRKYTTKDGDQTGILLDDLEDIAVQYRKEESVLTYLPLEPREQRGNEIIVIERYDSQENYEALQTRSAGLQKKADSLAESVEVTTWTDGIGHIVPAKS